MKKKVIPSDPNVPEGMKECPECDVQLPEEDTVCECGYEFWRKPFKDQIIKGKGGNC